MFDPWVGKIPWRRKWQPTLIFLPGNPMDRGAWQTSVHRFAESWTAEQLSTHAEMRVINPDKETGGDLVTCVKD